MEDVQSIGRIQSLEWRVPHEGCWARAPTDLQIQWAEICASQHLCRATVLCTSTHVKTRPLISSHLRLCWIRRKCMSKSWTWLRRKQVKNLMLSLPCQAANLFCLTFLVTGLKLLLPSAAEQRQLPNPPCYYSQPYSKIRKDFLDLSANKLASVSVSLLESFLPFRPFLCAGGIGLCI